NPMGQQLLVDALLQCRKNFTGQTAQDIVGLYERLGLKSAALRNLDSSRWDIKAHAIQELYLMDQHDVLRRIYKNVNNRHDLVRMEAQLGVLHLTGFEGLRFLDVISYPLSEWQQLKLLDQLGSSTAVSSLGDAIPKWLRSSNDSVAQFALKLADQYQLVGLHDDIALCLQHRHPLVRSQAIGTLLRIASDKTPGLLAARYGEEALTTRLTILAGLERIGTEEQSALLTALLEDDNDRVKLSAARALAHSSGQGLRILSEKARETPHPFENIYLQIKSEASR
ncbi:MAG: HEAT repeat domain-containing protein, partial [Bacteroidota bacterium]|nr:HEAT repeat domain-containing protein [Bacteroidota bacterium]